jgi:2-keto-4-pentenoate hydratase/2-oxohepta-3-ene-1,7-dioic acid hydratase in catechol pathway
MKIIRYSDNSGRIHFGAESDGGTFRIEGDIRGGQHSVTEEPAQVTKLLAPIVPTEMLCIGLNYREHAKESGAEEPKYPVVFMKSSNALQNPGDPIEIPRHLASEKVDYEGELAIVIGRTCKNIAKEQALNYVLGYTIANDVSARDWQRERGGGQFCRAKSFDTFAPIGPRIVTTDELPDPQALRIRTTVSGEVLQDGSTADMIFDVATLIEFLSGSTTLLAGAVILTGTPPGVGMGRTPPRWLRAGDEVSVEIDGIGKLTNPVTEENV